MNFVNKTKYKLFLYLKKKLHNESVTEHNEKILKRKLLKLIEKLVYITNGNHILKVFSKQQEYFFFIPINDDLYDHVSLRECAGDYVIQYNNEHAYYKKKEILEILNYLEDRYGKERCVIKSIDQLCDKIEGVKPETKLQEWKF